VTPSSLCGDDVVEGDMVYEVRSFHHLLVAVMELRGEMVSEVRSLHHLMVVVMELRGIWF